MYVTRPRVAGGRPGGAQPTPARAVLARRSRCVAPATHPAQKAGRSTALIAAAATAKPITPGSSYPAGAFCSTCGLCDTPLIARVKDACAFLGDGMARLDALEPALHGRPRCTDPGSAEVQLGVIQDQFYARAVPSVRGAQWTGIVTSTAVAALETGLVDAVVCVASAPDDPLSPRPIIARTPDEVRSAAGVKATLSPSLEVLPALQALAASGDVRRALFIGVGCQVQAVRAVQGGLGLEALFVMGTNCTDNGPREGLDTFLRVRFGVCAWGRTQGRGWRRRGERGGFPPLPIPPALTQPASPPPFHSAHTKLQSVSASPDTARHYEFHVDFRVHIVHTPGTHPTERIPYFSLPATELADGVIAPSCTSCFDYANGAADLVVGYMGVPYGGDATPMAASWQHVVVRNERGAALLAALGTHGEAGGPGRGRLEVRPVESVGDPAALARGTVEADDAARLGKGPAKPMPRWVGTLLAWLLTRWLAPRGLAFAQYSIDYHVLRNYLFVRRHGRRGGRGGGGGGPPLPAGARATVERYDRDGWLTRVLGAGTDAGPSGPVVKGRTSTGWWVGGGRPAGVAKESDEQQQQCLF